jgi:hypothetical protein
MLLAPSSRVRASAISRTCPRYRRKHLDRRDLDPARRKIYLLGILVDTRVNIA